MLFRVPSMRAGFRRGGVHSCRGAPCTGACVSLLLRLMVLVSSNLIAGALAGLLLSVSGHALGCRTLQWRFCILLLIIIMMLSHGAASQWRLLFALCRAMMQSKQAR